MPDELDDLIGHNSQLNETTRELLRQTVAKIERLEEEKKEVADQIKDVYAEAKAVGFDTKILRKIIAYRKRDRAEIEEEEMVFECYASALGLI